MARAEQLPLVLPHRPDMDREVFLVGEANAAALALIDRWPDWPGAAALLSGPPGSGKSHLGAIWATRSSARLAGADDVATAIAGGFAGGMAVLVEDLDVEPRDEQGLFHLLNLARENRGSVLLTSRLPATELDIGLPDLASRLRAAETVTLGPPDDDLLRNLLAKLFSDRQLAVEPPVLDFLLRRMERSYASAHEMVERIDRAALAEGKRVSRALAAAVLSAGSEAAEEGA